MCRLKAAASVVQRALHSVCTHDCSGMYRAYCIFDQFYVRTPFTNNKELEPMAVCAVSELPTSVVSTKQAARDKVLTVAWYPGSVEGKKRAGIDCVRMSVKSTLVYVHDIIPYHRKMQSFAT